MRAKKMWRCGRYGKKEALPCVKFGNCLEDTELCGSRPTYLQMAGRHGDFVRRRSGTPALQSENLGSCISESTGPALAEATDGQVNPSRLNGSRAHCSGNERGSSSSLPELYPRKGYSTAYVIHVCSFSVAAGKEETNSSLAWWLL
jgi:hypothetical protein